MTLVCKVGSTDIAAGGQLDLTSLRLEPCGDNVYGTAQFLASSLGGAGFAPVDHQQVQIYEVDGSGNVTRRYFGGAVADIETTQDGANKVWKITCRDYNEQLDALTLEDVIKGTTASTSFPAQVAEMVNKVQTWSAAPTTLIDATSQVPDLTPGYTGYAHRSWAWTTLRKILTDLCAGAQAHTATLRPRYYMGLTDTGTTFGPATLYVYDGAATPLASVKFSDRTSDILAGTHKPIFKTYKRKLDGTRLTDRLGVLGANGLYSVAQDTTAKTRYPNPYSSTNSWSAAPISDTSLVVQADVDARAAAEVAAHAFSRETTEIVTDQWVRPGQYVSVTNTLEGLSNVIYPVIAVQIDFSNPLRTWYTLSLGARRLELGDDDTGGGLPPVERDTVPPAPPTGLTLAGNSYVRARNQTDLTFTWTANSDADLANYVLWLTLAGATTPIDLGLITSYTIPVTPGTAFSAYLTAVDTSGNKSSASGTVSGTAAVAVAENPAPPTGLSVTGAGQVRNADGMYLDLQWTTPSGGTGTAYTYDVQVTWTDSNGSVDRTLWFSIVAPGTLVAGSTYRGQIAGGLAAGIAYSIRMRSRTVLGDVGTTWSNTYVYTIASGISKTLYNPSFELIAPGNSLRADGWTYTITTGTTTDALDSTTSADGARSQKVTATVLSGGFATLQLDSTPFLVPGGQPSIVYYSLRSSRTDTTIFPSVNYYDRTGAGIGSSSASPASPTATNTWETTYIQALPGPPAGAVTAALSLVVRLAAVGATANLDGCDVRPMATTQDLQDATISTKTLFGVGLVATQKGASNPASPSTDDHNWRTDIDRAAYYDGTRWVTPDVKILSFVNDAALTATTTSGANVGRLNHNGDLDWLLYRWAVSIFVATTNDASNYWSLTLRYVTAGNTVTTVATMTTAAKSPNVWDRIATATFSPATAPVGAYMLEIIATKVGSPGSLLAVPSLLIREIIP